MFGTNFKTSLLALPWLVLPLAVLAFFAVIVDPWVQENGYALRRESNTSWLADAGVTEDEESDEGLKYEGDEGFEEDIDEESGESVTVYRWLYSSACVGLSTVIAITVNFLLLLIIPCALGGFDGGKKRFEFYLGFFINLALMIAMPLIYFLFYDLDHTTFALLLALHAVSFMATFIIGSRFVSPAYRKAFWFA